jgi:hypothetical protein
MPCGSGRNALEAPRDASRTASRWWRGNPTCPDDEGGFTTVQFFGETSPASVSIAPNLKWARGSAVVAGSLTTYDSCTDTTTVLAAETHAVAVDLAGSGRTTGRASQSWVQNADGTRTHFVGKSSEAFVTGSFSIDGTWTPIDPGLCEAMHTVSKAQTH